MEPNRRTLAVDSNNDLVMGQDGVLKVARGIEAASIVCEQFARAARGEMIHKKDKGMPFFETAFGSGSNPAQYEAAFRNRMRQIPQVLSVESFRAEIVEGTLKYEALLETEFGTMRMSNA